MSSFRRCCAGVILTVCAFDLRAQGRQMQLQQELRIDGNAANLVPVHWMAMHADGRIAVSQRQDYSVRIFDASGNQLARSGGWGEGPGEFSRLGYGGWRGDTLWIEDSRNRFINMFSKNGALIRSVPLGLLQVPPRLRDSIFVLPDFDTRGILGEGVLLASSFRSADRRTPLVDPPPSGFLKVRTQGELVQFVIWNPPRAGGVVRYTPSEPTLPAGGIGAMSVPFFAEPIHLVSPLADRIVHVKTHFDRVGTGTITVLIHTNAGQLLHTGRLQMPATSIPARAIDSALANRLPDDRNREALIAKARSLAPQFYPLISAAFMDNDRRIWLGLAHKGNSRRWIILNERGETDSWLDCSPSILLRAASGTRVWGTESDRDNVESIVRFRLRER